jgi:hypothetical protein
MKKFALVERKVPRCTSYPTRPTLHRRLDRRRTQTPGDSVCGIIIEHATCDIEVNLRAFAWHRGNAFGRASAEPALAFDCGLAAQSEKLRLCVVASTSLRQHGLRRSDPANSID